MPNPFAAVIFDMDGTLVESEQVWEIAEGDMLSARGLDYNDAVRQTVIGLRLDEFFSRIKAHYGLTESIPALIAELEERVKPLVFQHVVPKPGAQELIDYVREQGLPYCIASSSSQPVIEAIMEAVGWQDLMPRRYSADLVAYGKPAPDVYLYAAEQLSANPARCLALEDSANGARSAVAAGMTCYAIPDFHTDPAKFAEITPHVYPSLHEILAELRA